MAIIFSYSPIQSTDVTASDRLILSQMNSDGNPTRSITVGELSKFISNTPAGGPFLPLTAGSTVPLTGDLYMAPNGAGPSAGSRAIVFRGIDDTGTELSSAEIFTLDSSINPSGQDLYFNNADDAGVLQTNLFIDAFGSVGINNTSPSKTLDVGGSFNADGNVTFSGYGSGTKTGTATYSLAVDASGNVIEEPLTSGTVTGTGTTDYFVKFIDGPNGIIGDVPGVIEQAGEVIFQQDVRFDDVVLFDGGTVESFQNVEILDGAAIKFIDTAGPTTDAQLSSVPGSSKLNIVGQLQFDDYGSGTITGTAAYGLSVDASGNIIETATGGGATFTSSNSSASGRIRIGATASTASTSADAVFIGSSLTNSNNDEQINIGYNNTGTGTQNMIYGANNTQSAAGAYSIIIGTFNQSSGSVNTAIGRNHNLASGNTHTLGESNQSTFTGGVSSAGLMNVSVGYANQLDVNRGAVLGFANDITGSFGWTLGSGNETVVVGSRLTMSLLGPNRSGTTGPRVIIATGEFIGAAENKKNSVEYYTPEASRSGVFHPALYNSASYADDTAAAAGGVRLGELYRNGSVIQIRMT